MEDIKHYIQENLVEDQPDLILTKETKLITDGHLDSISVMMLVSYIEKQYNIEFDPQEVDEDNLNTLDQIESFIRYKRNE